MMKKMQDSHSLALPSTHQRWWPASEDSSVVMKEEKNASIYSDNLKPLALAGLIVVIGASVVTSDVPSIVGYASESTYTYVRKIDTQAETYKTPYFSSRKSKTTKPSTIGKLKSKLPEVIEYDSWS